MRRPAVVAATHSTSDAMASVRASAGTDCAGAGAVVGGNAEGGHHAHFVGGHARFLEGQRLLDDFGRGADQVDLLVRRRALALERGFGERDQVLVHLALAEALDRLLVRLAEVDDELRADLDGAPVAAGPVGLLAQRRHAGAAAVLGVGLTRRAGHCGGTRPRSAGKRAGG